MKPLRICLVSKEYPPAGFGGVANYSRLLANGLAAVGHDVTVVTGGTSARSQPISPKQGSPTLYFAQLHKIPLPPAVRRRSSGFLELLERSWAVEKAIARLERKQGNFDVVEMSNWGIEALFYSLRPRAPLAIRLSTPLQLSHQFKDLPATRLGFRLHCFLEALPVRRADCAIAHSRFNADYCTTLYRLPAAKVHVIHLGVKIHSHLPAMTRAGGKSVCVLCVARLQKRKGIHLLLQAIPLVTEKMPHVKFVIAGFDSGDAPRLAAATAEESQAMTYHEYFLKTAPPAAREATAFLGHVDNTTLQQLYTDGDILVAPSLSESFGLMYAEAMSYAKPVVAFRAGAASEIVVHNETGILVEPYDVGELANALIRLAEDSERRHRIGTNGYNRVCKEFSVERMVDATISVYRQVIAARRGD